MLNQFYLLVGLLGRKIYSNGSELKSDGAIDIEINTKMYKNN